MRVLNVAGPLLAIMYSLEPIQPKQNKWGIYYKHVSIWFIAELQLSIISRQTEMAYLVLVGVSTPGGPWTDE
jgi:hypothetical protein